MAIQQRLPSELRLAAERGGDSVAHCQWTRLGPLLLLQGAILVERMMTVEDHLWSTVSIKRYLWLLGNGTHAEAAVRLRG